MKLKLNKKKMKSLTNDSKTIPANATPQIAGGGFFTEGRLTHCLANTCGMGHTCKDIY